MSANIVYAILVTSLATFLSSFLGAVLSLAVFFVSNKNFVYPTIFSAICMAIINNYI